METIIIFPLLSRPDNSRKVLLKMLLKIFDMKIIIFFSAHINLFHIFNHLIFPENGIFTKIDC